jgi:hypothetical protein
MALVAVGAGDERSAMPHVETGGRRADPRIEQLARFFASVSAMANEVTDVPATVDFLRPGTRTRSRIRPTRFHRSPEVPQ